MIRKIKSDENRHNIKHFNIDHIKSQLHLGMKYNHYKGIYKYIFIQ